MVIPLSYVIKYHTLDSTIKHEMGNRENRLSLTNMVHFVGQITKVIYREITVKVRTIAVEFILQQYADTRDTELNL